MIEVVDIHKSFGDNHVLKGISICFEKGKTNLIIGQSGSGKTVLLKSIVGLHEVDTGEILFDGRDFTKMKIKKRKEIRKEIGMVFQGGALFDSATVLENVMFPMNMFTDFSEKKKREQAQSCLRRVNLDKADDLYPAEISGGMQKRVSIARAIALNPKYLFCDEPNSGLDPRTGIVIDQLIQEITREYDITTVINTHDMNSVTEIGDNILYLYKGEKCWVGTKNEIFNSGNKLLDNFVFATKLMKRIKQDVKHVT